MQNSKQIRMCLSCRTRNKQKSMVRLQQKINTIVTFEGKGRSFYLCHACIQDENKTKSLTKRFKQDQERFVKFLKELIKNG